MYQPNPAAAAPLFEKCQPSSGGSATVLDVSTQPSGGSALLRSINRPRGGRPLSGSVHASPAPAARVFGNHQTWMPYPALQPRERPQQLPRLRQVSWAEVEKSSPRRRRLSWQREGFGRSGAGPRLPRRSRSPWVEMPNPQLPQAKVREPGLNNGVGRCRRGRGGDCAFPPLPRISLAHSAMSLMRSAEDLGCAAASAADRSSAGRCAPVRRHLSAASQHFGV